MASPPSSSGRVADVGLTVLYSPEHEESIVADIVFVHGLQGHPRKTWTKPSNAPKESEQDEEQKRGWRSRLGVSKKQQSQRSVSPAEDDGVFWPADLLPQECSRARILTFGYNSSITNFFGPAVNQDSPSNVAKNLLFGLTRLRKKNPHRSLILVAHSLGGIVVKEALRRSAIAEDEAVRNFQTSLWGIVFMGTPHGGGNFQNLGEVMRRIVSAIGMDSNDKMLGTLRFESEELERSREEFTRLWRSRFRVKTFQEARGLKGIQGFNNKVVPDFSSTLNDPLERPETIDANHMEMCRFSGADDPGYHQVSGELSDWVEERSKSANLANTDALMDTDGLSPAQKACLQSFSFPSLETRIHQVDRPHDGTCRWIFDHPRYLTWRSAEMISSSSNTLWLKGKVGSGKSVCSRVVFDELQKEASSISGMRVLHFFFTDQDPESPAATQYGLFRSLLWQMLQTETSLFECILPAYHRKVNTYGDDFSWNFFEVKQLFQVAMTRTKAEHTFIVLDALDECSSADELLGYLQYTVGAFDTSTHNVRWFLASRHYPVLSMPGSLEISMDEMNHDDIDVYVTERLSTKPPRPDFQSLLSEVSRRASGVFLWAVLVVKTLLNARAEYATPAEMMEILDTLPKKFETLVHEIFRNIGNSEHAGIACRIMQIVAFATRPLTAIELAWALEVGTDEGRRSHKDVEKSPSFISQDRIEHWVRARTQGLVEVTSDDSNNGVVQFIHGTIRQALHQRGFSQIRPDLKESPVVESHHMVAMTCVTYLSLREFTILKTKIPDALPMSHIEAGEYLRDLYQRYPLLEYAVESLFSHIAHVKYSQSLISTPSSIALKRTQGVFKIWSRLSDISLQSRYVQVRDSDVTFGHVAAEYNVGSWLLELIDQKFIDVNASASRFGSLLATAAAFGNETLAQSLILHGADVNGPGGSYGCILACAAAKGLFDLTNDLLENGCDVNADGRELGSPLQAAAFSTSNSLDIVQLMLGANAEVDKIAGSRFGTALQASAFTGNIDIIDALVDAGADVNLVSGEYGCALEAAACNGNEEAVDLLLAYDADPKIVCGRLGTTIHAAACDGHEKIVRTLLEAQKVSGDLDALVKKTMVLGSQAKLFEEAIEANDEILVRTLLQQDNVDVNIRVPEFMTTFHTAAYHARRDIMRLLLGACEPQPDLADHLGRTPLLMAAAEGHLPVVEVLLEWESGDDNRGKLDFKATTDMKHNILFIPCARRQHKIVELLLPKEADPYEKDIDGVSAYDVGDDICKKLIVQYGVQRVDLGDENR